MKAKKAQRPKSSMLLTLLLLSNIFIVALPSAISDNQVNISFLPLKNEPPDVPKISSPLNGSVNITIPVTLEVKVWDNTSNFVDVYFYNASDNSLKTSAISFSDCSVISLFRF